MKKFLLILVFCPVCVFSQSLQRFNLRQLLDANKLSYLSEEVVTGADSAGETNKNAITAQCRRFPGDEVGIPWLKDIKFTTGTIDVDLRGRDSTQLSFIGIVFHGIDTADYEAIFFRPFRFRASDASTYHSIQYVSYPEYRWQKLRKESPLIYENAVNPAPGGNDWFHAQIVVSEEWVTVYVDHSPKASLKVKKLNNRKTGKIGLYNVGYPGDFANLVVKPG